MTRKPPPPARIRRLAPGDATALAAFYGGLSAASIRTFRPLGPSTTVEACEAVVAANLGDAPQKFDLVIDDGTGILGWSFLWKLNTDEPLFGLGVADALHGQGWGGTLTDAVLAAARARRLAQVLLTVVQDNVRAVRLYGNRGFVRYGEFIDPHDGLPYYRMRWTLPA